MTWYSVAVHVFSYLLVVSLELLCLDSELNSQLRKLNFENYSKAAQIMININITNILGLKLKSSLILRRYENYMSIAFGISDPANKIRGFVQTTWFCFCSMQN